MAGQKRSITKKDVPDVLCEATRVRVEPRASQRARTARVGAENRSWVQALSAGTERDGSSKFHEMFRNVALSYTSGNLL